MARMIKDFLTQRALQTLVFYYEQLAEGTLAEYLERFNGHDGISRYHGFRGLKSPWKEYVKRLLSDEPFDVVVKKPARRQGTPGNPYIVPKYFTYTEHVQPSRIARKLLEVRASVALELARDLALVPRDNDMLEIHYRNELLRTDSSEQRPPGEMASSHAATLSALCDHNPAFNANTPLRGGTYDLVMRMATWCAVQRVARAATAREKEYLDVFLREQGRWFLDDAVPRYNVGKTFLRELMAASPVLLDGPNASGGTASPSASRRRKKRKDVISAVVPLDLARRVMQARADIAAGWKNVVERDTDADHLSLQQEFLNRSL